MELTPKIVSKFRTDALQMEVYDTSFRAGGSFGVRVSRNGRKVFFLIYKDGIRRRRLSLGTFPVVSLEQARARAIRALSQVEGGQDPRKSKDPELRAQGSFATVAEEYLNSQVEKLSFTTIREYRRIVRKYLLPLWGEREIGSLVRAEIFSFLSELAHSAKGQDRGERPAMANRIRTLVGLILEHARQRQLVNENPIRTLPRAGIERSAGRLLTDIEIRNFWWSLEGESVSMRAFFKLLFFTGIRSSTAMRLKWNDIILDSVRIRERGVLRELYLVPELVEVLKELKSYQTVQSQYLFPGKSGGPLTYIRRAARRISARAGLQSGISALDIRRSVRGRLIGLRVPNLVVVAILDGCRKGLYPPSPQDVQQALLDWTSKLLSITGPSRYAR